MHFKHLCPALQHADLECPEHSDFGIVIQGRIHANTIPMVINCLNYTEHVVVAHYDKDFVPPEHLRPGNKGVTVKWLALRDTVPPEYYNQQNVYLQMHSTLAGLQELPERLPHAIKLRTDKYYQNLRPLMDRIRQNTERVLTTCNLHFRPSDHIHFHPSDQMFGASRERLIQCIKLAESRCTNQADLLRSGAYEYRSVQEALDAGLKRVDQARLEVPWTTKGHDQQTWKECDVSPPVIGLARELFNGYWGTFPEVVLGTSWLLSNDIFPDRQHARELMRRHFDIVRIEDMGQYYNTQGLIKI